MYSLCIMNDDKIDKLTTYARKRGKGKHLTQQEKQEIQEKFLASFAVNANVSASCKIASITRTTVYEWQEHDEQFSMRYKAAEQEANDVIRAELFRRGVEGYDKPVVSMGRVVYGSDGYPLTEKVYSDNLLSLLAKARMPEFKDKQQIDMNMTNVQKDTQELHKAIADALEPYPEARQAVARALVELEKTRGSKQFV